MDCVHPARQAADNGDGARRACDQCRLRKVRCDRQSPCANCTTAHYHCSFSSTTSQLREQRHKVLVSSQYEKKINDLETRLDKITNVVEKIAEAQARASTSLEIIGAVPRLDTATMQSIDVSPTTPQRHSFLSGDQGQDRLAALAEHAAQQADNLINDTRPTTARQLAQQTASDFHGTSSVAAHALFAGQFVEDAVTGTTIDNADAGHRNMHVALESLQQLLRMQRQHSIASETHLQHVKTLGAKGLAGLALPPLESVVAILRELRERNTLTFTLICVFDSIESFTDMCKRVYFATEPFSTVTFISVCTGLYYLFQEKAAIALQEVQENDGQGEARAEEYRAHCMTCRDNLETALAHLSLLQPLKQETVEALIMAESYATEISKPSLAWQLNAAACQAVLAMGYHRKDYLPGETTDLMRRRRAVRFWFVYILDRGLALRFGRSPNLPDYDITLPRHIGPLDEPFQVHCATIQGWLHHAQAQGQAYETLYSPIALLQPIEQRVRSARSCANNLLEEVRVLTESRMRLEMERDGAATGDGISSIAAMLLKADEVSIRSTLTLVYRAIPPSSIDDTPGSSSTFCVECVECARDVMQLHFECMQMLERNTHLAPAYMHWTILFSPFIPFIVLFCHAIENCNRGDLVCLDKFKSSLEQFRNISEPVDRLYRLCEMLCDVAHLYFEAKQAPAQQQHRLHQQPCYNADVLDGPGPTTSMISAEFQTHLGHAGNLLGIDEGILPGFGSYYPTDVESQATQAANWYLDYVNMVGWSEQSPSSWPR